MQVTVIIAESTAGNTPCISTQSRDKADHGDGFQTPTHDSGIMVEEKVDLQKVKDAQYFFFQMSNRKCANLRFFLFCCYSETRFYDHLGNI